MSNNPYLSFSASTTNFPGHSKNTSGCTKRVKHHSKDSQSFQQSQNLSEPLVERFNLSNQTMRVGPDSFLLHNLPAQMEETSSNNQSSQNFQLNNYMSFEGQSVDLINEEEKSNENLEVLPESFNDESENFEKHGSHQDQNTEGSLKSDVDSNTADDVSDILRDGEDVSEVEDDEKVKWKETQEIIEKLKSPVSQLVKELEALKRKALKGELLEAYDGLIQIKQENPIYFEEGHEDFFSVNFYQTLILFLGCLYKETLPGLFAMKEFYKENKDYIKIGIDINDEKVGDDDVGVLYHKIGKCESELGIQEGIKYLEKALRKLEESRAKNPEKQPFLLMNCHSSLTQHYLKYGREERAKEKAKEHSQKALAFAKELKEQEGGMAPINQSLARCYINYCDTFSFIGDQEKAQKKLKKAENYLKKYLNGSALELHHMGARIKRSQAQIDWKNTRYDRAIELYELAIKIIEKTMPPKAKLKEDYSDELQKLKEEREESLKNQKVIEESG